MRPNLRRVMYPRSKTKTPLELAIGKAMKELDEKEVGSEEYVKILEAVTKLHKMREEEKPSRVSKDTALTVGANLLGIFLIIRHEHVNVITSRAISMLLRSRL
jgi:hypothetical protein